MFTALTASCLWTCLGAARADHPDIFYNFYNGPTAVARVSRCNCTFPTAPRATSVGHTWITYPPLMPHEFLYHHHRKYYKYYRNGGWVSSCVKYH